MNGPISEKTAAPLARLPGAGYYQALPPTFHLPGYVTAIPLQVNYFTLLPTCIFKGERGRFAQTPGQGPGRNMPSGLPGISTFLDLYGDFVDFGPISTQSPRRA
jgi:hypothetical protein